MELEGPLFVLFDEEIIFFLPPYTVSEAEGKCSFSATEKAESPALWSCNSAKKGYLIEVVSQFHSKYICVLFICTEDKIHDSPCIVAQKQSISYMKLVHNKICGSSW